jgi:hypothetical protein
VRYFFIGEAASGSAVLPQAIAQPSTARLIAVNSSSLRRDTNWRSKDAAQE